MYSKVKRSRAMISKVNYPRTCYSPKTGIKYDEVVLTKNQLHLKSLGMPINHVDVKTKIIDPKSRMNLAELQEVNKLVHLNDEAVNLSPGFKNNERISQRKQLESA